MTRGSGHQTLFNFFIKTAAAPGGLPGA